MFRSPYVSAVYCSHTSVQYLYPFSRLLCNQISQISAIMWQLLCVLLLFVMIIAEVCLLVHLVHYIARVTVSATVGLRYGVTVVLVVFVQTSAEWAGYKPNIRIFEHGCRNCTYSSNLKLCSVTFMMPYINIDYENHWKYIWGSI